VAIRLDDTGSLETRPGDESSLTYDRTARAQATPWELLRYRSNDLWEDAAWELVDLLKISRTRAMELVRQTLKDYANGIESPTGANREVTDLVLYITQPIRKPHMLERMGTILLELESAPWLRTALDYGGGGGKDSILYARSGYEVTYCDLLGSLIPYVEERFRLRKIDVSIRDVRDLGEARYDLINCMDVVEHVYDTEYVLADITARLHHGGHLICYPAFMNLWNGDHIEKNCGYVSYWVEMLECVGFRLFQEEKPRPSLRNSLLTSLGVRLPEIPVVHLVRQRPVNGSVSEERDAVREELYRLSARWSTRCAWKAFLVLPIAAVVGWTSFGRARVRSRNVTERLLGTITDNLAIRRLSNHRLEEVRTRERNAEVVLAATRKHR